VINSIEYGCISFGGDWTDQVEYDQISIWIDSIEFSQISVEDDSAEFRLDFGRDRLNQILVVVEFHSTSDTSRP